MRLARLMDPIPDSRQEKQLVELIRKSPTVSGSIAETHLIFCAFCLENPFAAQPVTYNHIVAIFRQINKSVLHIHHDALEFPDGEIVLLTRLCEGQKATILTLPTQPKPAAEAEVQHRVAYVG
jgi:hypothetical protein